MAIELNSTMDAQVWAKEFMRTLREHGPIIDEEFMLAWFANAIMCGYDTAMNRMASRQVEQADPWENRYSAVCQKSECGHMSVCPECSVKPDAQPTSDESKACPDCNRPMEPRADKRADWWCSYCGATWTPASSISSADIQKAAGEMPKVNTHPEACRHGAYRELCPSTDCKQSSDTYQAHHCRHGTRGVYCFDFHPSHEREKCDQARQAAFNSKDSPK